jgi:hypothetical protein
VGIDGENALEKFDDLVKGCDYDGVHTMHTNLQTPAAGAKAGKPSLGAFIRKPLRPSICTSELAMSDERLRLAWIAQ